MCGVALDGRSISPEATGGHGMELPAWCGPIEEAQCVPIRHEADLIDLRHLAEAVSSRLGFTGAQRAAAITALFELAHNMLDHAGGGEVLIGIVRPAAGDDSGARPEPAERMLIVARDRGPGIADMDLALRDGYSTVGSLGLGLPGVRRLMDEFAITSTVGRGTTVVCCKWAR